MEIKLKDGYLLKLNKNNYTASILKFLNSSRTLRIPRSIKVESQNYLILKIEEFAFNNCSSLSHLIISETVKLIQNFNFNVFG